MTKRVFKAAHASFRVHGEELDPLDVTRALRIPSDHSHRSGEPRLTRSKRGKIVEHANYRSGMWSMSSKRWVNSPRLAIHLEWLLEQLEPYVAELVTFRAMGATTDFFCYSSGTTDEKPSISKAIRERAAALGISIEIDHYRT